MPGGVGGVGKENSCRPYPDSTMAPWTTPTAPSRSRTFEWIGQERWESDPELSHEFYNSGHLFEAGAAHFEATGNRALLEVCLRSAARPPGAAPFDAIPYFAWNNRGLGPMAVWLNSRQ